MCLVGSYGNLLAALFPKMGNLSLATFPLALSAFPQFPPETKKNQPKASDYLFVWRWGNVHTIWIWPSLLDPEDICENDTLADWFEEQGGDRQSWCPGQGFQPCTRRASPPFLPKHPCLHEASSKPFRRTRQKSQSHLTLVHNFPSISFNNFLISHFRKYNNNSKQLLAKTLLDLGCWGPITKISRTRVWLEKKKERERKD